MELDCIVNSVKVVFFYFMFSAILVNYISLFLFQWRLFTRCREDYLTARQIRFSSLIKFLSVLSLRKRYDGHKILILTRVHVLFLITPMILSRF